MSNEENNIVEDRVVDISTSLDELNDITKHISKELKELNDKTGGIREELDEIKNEVVNLGKRPDYEVYSKQLKTVINIVFVILAVLILIAIKK